MLPQQKIFKFGVSEMPSAAFSAGQVCGFTFGSISLHLISKSIKEILTQKRQYNAKYLSQFNDKNGFRNYNPALPHLAHIIHKHSNVLYSSDRCRNVFKNLPLVAYRRCKNISDILVRAQLTNSTDTSNSRPTPGSFRCNNRNCTTCPYIEHGVINTLFILQVRPTTSNLISLVKLLMLSI